MAMEMKTVDVRNGRFRIETFETGSGSPLLYLHGEDGLPEGPFFEGLAKNYRVIAPRHPGLGNSTGDDYLDDMWDLLYFYLDYMDALGLEQVAIAGHGLGGMFAAELAAMQPSRFTKVVLIAPFGLWNGANPTMDYFVGSPAEVAKATFADPEGELAKGFAKPQNEGDLGPILERVKSQRIAAKYLWPIPNRGLSKRIHRVTPPTLVLWGKQDGIIPPAYADDFDAALPNATVALLDNAGHLPHLEQPQAALGAVERFMK